MVGAQRGGEPLPNPCDVWQDHSRSSSFWPKVGQGIAHPAPASGNESSPQEQQLFASQCRCFRILWSIELIQRSRERNVRDVVLSRDARPGRRLGPQVPLEQIVEAEHFPQKPIRAGDVDPLDDELRVELHDVVVRLDVLGQFVRQTVPDQVWLERPLLVDRRCRGGKVDRTIAQRLLHDVVDQEVRVQEESLLVESHLDVRREAHRRTGWGHLVQG